jgi:formate dehydrogenase major subunit
MRTSLKRTRRGTGNRWLTTVLLAASAASSEMGYLTRKTVPSLGILTFDNQTRV